MKTMDIEVVDIRKIVGDGNLKAFADLKFANEILVKGFTVTNGKNGLFVSGPRKPAKDGRWFDILTPLNDEMKQEIEGKVLEAFDRETDGVRS
jgi:DNA-binding cell septation regulator SpoVG